MTIFHDHRPRPRDWVMAIKDDLKQIAENEKEGPPPRNVMRRVRRQIRERKPEHYAVEEFSFGLFDRSPLGSPKTRAEQYKLLMASAALEAMGMTEEDDWEKLCDMVIPNPKETQDLYDEVDRDPLPVHEVQSVLTLDAIFVATFLGQKCSILFRSLFPNVRLKAKDVGVITSLYLLRDIFKVENQIPLSLICTVLRILVDKVVGHVEHSRRITLVDDIVEAICYESFREHSAIMPGYPKLKCTGSLPNGIPLRNCNHLLDCFYRTMCQRVESPEDNLGVSGVWDKMYNYFLGCICRRMCKHGEEDGSGLDDETGLMTKMNLPSVIELQKAGIEFRGYEGHFHAIHFKEGLLKGILHLPSVIIFSHTEEVWRNIVAYENNLHDSARNGVFLDEFTCYLWLMTKLIVSPKDVKVLRSGKSPVIVGNSMYTDEFVARIFTHGILFKCYRFDVQSQWSLLQQQIYEFYNHDQRRMFLEFMQTYFGRWWLTISVVAATVLLTMAFIQTYYTVAGYYHTF